MRRRGLLSLAWASTLELFDQGTAFGRLALVHVTMMAGDTLVTISLAGSLFFSVSPTEAKGKVLAYLLLTIAPFAFVSPVLGPLIDRSRNGRRLVAAASAVVRVVLCWMMSRSLNSLWLYPEAFVMLVASRLYVVTRGALVPQMARSDELRHHGHHVDDRGWPSNSPTHERGFAGFNAQLTLLGTLAGLITGSIGVGILKGIGASSVLVVAAAIFIVATIASMRLHKSEPTRTDPVAAATPVERDLQALQPHGDAEVTWGLGAAAVIRGLTGFTTFLLAFGLRREHAALGWFAFALTLSAIGALFGLAVVTRTRDRVRESTMLNLSLVAIFIGATLAARFPLIGMQVALAAWFGAAASIAQPSFDSITQSNVPESAQGRTFARFAVRQQLLWVIGALVPVAISMSFRVGDTVVAAISAIGALVYLVGRRWATR